MTARARQLLLGLAGLGISVVALSIVIRSVDLGAAAAALAAADLRFVAIGLAAYLVGLGLRVARWWRLLPTRPDGRQVALPRVLAPLMVGYLGNAVLPARLGEAIRAYLVARRESIPFGGVAGSVVLERIVDTATLAVLAFLAAASLGGDAWLVRGAAIAAAAGIIVVATLATIGLEPLLPLARIAIGWLPVGDRRGALTRTAEHFVASSGGAHRRPAVVVVAVLSLGAWLSDAAVFWLVGQALGLELSALGALLVTAITVLATAIPSAPGYLGTFELAAVSVAGAVGIPGPAAFAFAVLAHVMAIVPSAIGGSIALAGIGDGLRSISRAAVDEHVSETAGAPRQAGTP